MIFNNKPTYLSTNNLIGIAGIDWVDGEVSCRFNLKTDEVTFKNANKDSKLTNAILHLIRNDLSSFDKILDICDNNKDTLIGNEEYLLWTKDNDFDIAIKLNTRLDERSYLYIYKQ